MQPEDRTAEYVKLEERVFSVKKRFLAMYKKAHAGHVGSSLSCAELLVFLKLAWMRDDDTLMPSKGQAVAALYSVLAEVNVLTPSQIDSFYEEGTRLPALPPSSTLKEIPFATGSLGHGLSLCAGMALGARLDRRERRYFCLTSDGELQDPPEVIPAFYEKWRQGHDVVYGRRIKREGSRLLAICCRAFYMIFRGVSYVSMPLDAGDFALMDRKVVSEMLALPETDQFLRGLWAWVGFRQTGVDYVRPARAFGRSTHGRRKNLWWAKKGIFSFTFLPVELLGYAGATMTALSLLALIYEILDRLRRPEIPHGVSTIIVLIRFFGSLHLLAIAVVGEYVIKILEETKRRPKFIRKAVRHGGRQFNTAAEIAGFLGERQTAEGGAAPRSP